MDVAGFRPLCFERLPAAESLRRVREYRERMGTRRSVREFSTEPLPDGLVEEALAAAASAPSGANHQPWHFVVVRDPAVKRAIRVAAEEEERAFYAGRASQEWLRELAPLGTDEHKPFLEAAPCLIAIFTRKFNTAPDGSRLKNYYTAESVGIATGLLISALHLAGVATLTHTPSPMQFLNRILERPDTERPFLLLVVGYPVDGVRVPDIQRLPLEQLVSFR
jgi:nitroreductase